MNYRLGVGLQEAYKKIQSFKPKCLRMIDIAPWYVSNYSPGQTMTDRPLVKDAIASIKDVIKHRWKESWAETYMAGILVWVILEEPSMDCALNIIFLDIIY